MKEQANCVVAVGRTLLSGFGQTGVSALPKCNIPCVISTILVMAIASLCFSAGPGVSAMAKKYHAAGSVVVTPNGPKDGGDFGPGTRGTMTSGIQEAVGFALAKHKSVYIYGNDEPGALRNDVRYTLTRTLRIPAARNFRLKSGGCVLTYKKSTGDAVVFESQDKSNCRLGVIKSESKDGAVVRIKKAAGSTFEFNGLVGPGGAWRGPGAGSKSVGLLLDGSSGAIDGNKIVAIEIAGCDKGCWLSRACVNNRIDLALLDVCNTHLQVGGPDDASPKSNKIGAHIDSKGLVNSAGVRLYGRKNLLTLSVIQAAQNKSLIFEDSAKDNTVIAWELPDGIADKSKDAHNLVVKALPDGIRDPIPVESGQNQDLLDLCCYAPKAKIVGLWGAKAGEASETLASGVAGGEPFTIKTGDRVLFSYAVFSPAVCTEVKDRPSPDINRYHRMNYVVLSPYGPADGADFGPYTPGTRTSGIQEALNYAKKNAKDVYIGAGAMPVSFKCRNIYMTWDTIKVPPMQLFKLDGGESLIIYQRPTGDAVVFDSSMNSRYKFGIVQSLSNGAVIKLQPKSTGVDGVSVVNTSEFVFNALLGGGGAWQRPGVTGKGTGLLLDAAYGPIDGCYFRPQEIVGCETGIYLKKACTNNKIESQFVHICNTGVQIGDPGDGAASGNNIDALIDPQFLPDTTGARIFGWKNLLTLNVRQSGDGKSLVFEPEARDNLVVGLNLAKGFTNNATVPTNRIITTGAVGFKDVTTPAIPKSGEKLMNRGPYSVAVMIERPGKVSSWDLIDADGTAETFKADLFTGQQIVLDPGEQISINYKRAPAWRWKAMR